MLRLLHTSDTHLRLVIFDVVFFSMTHHKIYQDLLDTVHVEYLLPEISNLRLFTTLPGVTEAAGKPMGIPMFDYWATQPSPSPVVR